MKRSKPCRYNLRKRMKQETQPKHCHENIGICTLSDLPFEILNKIAMHKEITAKDIVSLTMTCWRMRKAFDSNYLWKKKVCQRWPFLISDTDSDKLCLMATSSEHNSKPFWKDFYREGHMIGTILNDFFNGVTRDFLFREAVPKSTMEDLEEQIEHLCFGFSKRVLIVELQTISSVSTNLTARYYTQKVAVHFKLKYDSPTAQSEKSKSATFYDALRSPVLIGWYDNHGNQRGSTSFPILKLMVRERLADLHPQHPVLLNEFEVTETRAPPRLDHVEQCQVLEAINHVLFTRMEFPKPIHRLYPVHPQVLQNSIDYSLAQKGQINAHTTSCAVFACLAREFHVECEVMDISASFNIRYRLISEMLPCKMLRPRRDNVKYRIGSVHRCRNSASEIPCVVLGWYRSVGELAGLWTVPVLLPKLINKNQPIYRVLFANGQIAFHAEDDLFPFPKRFPNDKVGKYFCEYEGEGRYVPNSALKDFYPEG